MSDDQFRYLIPREGNAQHLVALEQITERLRPLAESPTAQRVVLTFWAEGASSLPLARATVSPDVLGWWRNLIPAEATHMTIQTAPENVTPPS